MPRTRTVRCAGCILGLSLLALAFTVPAGCRSPGGSGGEPGASPWTGARSVFHANCTECHGERKRKAELDLRTHESVLRGSEYGPVVVPGRPEESRLFELASAGEMPPQDDRRLASDEVEALRAWIAAGAPE